MSSFLRLVFKLSVVWELSVPFNYVGSPLGSYLLMTELSASNSDKGTVVERKVYQTGLGIRPGPGSSSVTK